VKPKKGLKSNLAEEQRLQVLIYCCRYEPKTSTSTEHFYANRQDKL